MVRKKTIQRFEQWCDEPSNIDDLLTRIAEGGKLYQVCKDIEQPYTLVHPYLHSKPELKARYETARKQFADKIHDQKLELAEKALGAKEPVEVMGAKLASEIYSAEARVWNPDQYAEKREAAVQVNFNLADVSREIRELEGRLGIGAKVVEALPGPKVVEGEPAGG